VEVIEVRVRDVDDERADGGVLDRGGATETSML